LGRSSDEIADAPENDLTTDILAAFTDPKWVLLKGGHRRGAEAADLLRVRGRDTVRLASPRIPVRVRGTGCYLASAMAGLLATGRAPQEAATEAKGMVDRAIGSAERIGKGASQMVPADPAH